MKKEVRFSHQYGEKEDITLKKLIFYNVIFFIPVGLAFFASVFLARATYQYLEASMRSAMHFYMMVFVFIIFFFIIPYIRKRENVKGVRYALLGFLVVAIGLSIPSTIVNKNLNFLYNLFNHLAIYILLTFIYCPEILGMDVDLSKWFQSYKQMTIIIVYISIVTLFVFGFGWQYYQMYEDHPTNAFDIGFEKPPSYPTFVYYSIVSFTTIGYGEITPISAIARLFTSIEAMIGMIINVVFVAILFLYISNFQAFMRSAETEHKKEEREIRKIERKIGMNSKNKKSSRKKSKK